MLGIEESGGDRVAPHDDESPAHSSELASNLFTPEGKITLFQSLFRRRDVYAIRWEGKGDKSGYSPAAAMDWRAINAARQEERKRIARKTRILLPLTSDVIRKHLTGKHTVGMYPLLPDETCWFLAVDFDKKSWMADSTMCILNLCLLALLDVAVTCERRNRSKHAKAMQPVDP
jgi:hypothetical protein